MVACIYIGHCSQTHRLVTGQYLFARQLFIRASGRTERIWLGTHFERALIFQICFCGNVSMFKPENHHQTGRLHASTDAI